MEKREEPMCYVLAFAVWGVDYAGRVWVGSLQVKVANRQKKDIVIDLEDLHTVSHFPNLSTLLSTPNRHTPTPHHPVSSQYAPQSTLLPHILSNARQYLNLFASSIDGLLPAPTIDIALDGAEGTDVLDVIMDQRRERNVQMDEAVDADGVRTDGATVGDAERFPPELLRR
jgi:hypothetical protein